MKKLIAVLMALMLTFSFTGCSMVEEIFEESDIFEDIADSIDDVFDEMEDILR